MPILERLEELVQEMVELRPHFCLCIRLLRQQHISIQAGRNLPAFFSFIEIISLPFL